MQKNTATPTRKATPAKARKAPAPAPAPKPAAVPANCGCGCGAPTITARAAFLAGHDARMAGVLGRAIGSGTATPEQHAQYDRASAPLRAKIDGIAATAKRKAATKAAKDAAKAAAAAAFDAAMASA